MNNRFASMIKRWWNKLPAWLKNRYILSAMLFAIWLAFFDQNDFYTQYKLSKELNKLESDKEYYLREIGAAKSDLNELVSDNEQLEKFAREKYFMKKSDEEIFLIVREE